MLANNNSVRPFAWFNAQHHDAVQRKQTFVQHLSSNHICPVVAPTHANCEFDARATARRVGFLSPLEKSPTPKFEITPWPQRTNTNYYLQRRSVVAHATPTQHPWISNCSGYRSDALPMLSWLRSDLHHYFQSQEQHLQDRVKCQHYNLYQVKVP